MQRFVSPRGCLLCSKSTAFLRQHHTHRRAPHTPKSALKPLNLTSIAQNLNRDNFCQFSTSSRLKNDDKDKYDFSKDSEVKRWMSELQSDFTNEQKKGEDETRPKKVKNEEEGISHSAMPEEEKRAAATHEKPNTNIASWTQFASAKYQRFGSGSPQIIYDYDEEQKLMEEAAEETEIIEEEFVLERGKTGVFDVEELVDLLREENAQDIVVIQVPPELVYVSYMVIASSWSRRHINALAEVVRRIYKKKKGKKDPSVALEGKATDWLAVDLGNIALHIMKPDIREAYDLETLWTVGAQFDHKCQAVEQTPLDYLNSFEQLQSVSALPEQLGAREIETTTVK